jgi:DNA-binding winged helix-turn-helix (wHTH) protein
MEGRIFDLILRTGNDGVLTRDLIDMVWPGEDAVAAANSLKVHIAHLNDKLSPRGYNIAGNTYRYLHKLGVPRGNQIEAQRRSHRTRYPAQAARRRDHR